MPEIPPPSIVTNFLLFDFKFSLNLVGLKGVTKQRLVLDELSKYDVSFFNIFVTKCLVEIFCEVLVKAAATTIPSNLEISS